MSQLCRTLVLIGAGSALLLAGCSGAPAATTPATQPAISSSATPVPTAQSPSASPSPTTTSCPDGEYTVSSFSAIGKDGSLAKGSGGNIEAEFDNGSYSLDFDKDSPVAFTLPSGTGKLIVDGEINGTYTGEGSTLRFTLGSTKGTAKLTDGTRSRSVTMKQLASIIGPNGSGSATCSGDRLTVEVGKTTFEMVRDN